MRLPIQQATRKHSNRILYSSLISAAMLAAINPAMLYAQEDDDAAEENIIEEVVVRGFRASLLSAIGNKRNADTQIESISAEDLGRLPDISIAEALARLPGITSQRTGGQASAINIRGLSQDLTFATLNGREQVSPSGSRVIEFEQFPSELISGVDVYKSSKASLIEGGVAGTVNMKTVKPLDSSKDFAFNINARASYSDLAADSVDANAYGYRLSASFQGKFADDKIGLALGYARLQQPDIATRYVGFAYRNGNSPGGVPVLDNDGNGQADAIGFGFELEEFGGKEVRDGLLAVVQWEPTEDLTIEIDGYYSKFTSESFGRGIRVFGTETSDAGNPASSTAVNNAVVVNNAIVSGTFTRDASEASPGNVQFGGFGLTVGTFNDDNSDNDELYTIGLNTEYRSGQWTFTGDFTYSRADSFFENSVSTIMGIDPASAPGAPFMDTDLAVDLQTDSLNIPTVGFNQDFTDLSSMFLVNYGIFPFENKDELYAFAGDVEYEVEEGFFTSIEAGVRYSEREATTIRTSADFGNSAGFFFGQGGFTPTALTSDLVSVQSFSSEFSDAGFPDFLALDVDAAVAQFIGEVTPDQSQAFTQTGSFVVKEKVLAGYIMGNFETYLSDMPLTGNVGVRVVRTKQGSTSTAFSFNPFGGFEIQSGATYTNILPSVNFSLELSDEDVLRLGGARTLSRAPIDDLNNGLNFDTSGGVPSGGGGNSDLRPFLANQIDISYERYFGDNSIFVAAAFYKDIESFIINGATPDFDFEAAGVPLPVGVTQTTGNFFQPLNGEGGYVWGLEFALTTVFDFLPHPLDGLGATLNYSYSDSKVGIEDNLSGSSVTLPLSGLSANVFNATIFYDLGGFSTRVGIRFRDRFVSPQLGLSEQLTFNHDELVVDYQASYQFDEGSALDGLTILFQANNLTDEPTITYFGQKAQTGTIQKFGRQFFLGASFSF